MIPFILVGISVVSAAIGVVEGVEGIDKLSKAKDIVEEYKKKYKNEYTITQKAANNFNIELEKVGKVKENLHRLRKEIKRTLESLQKKVKFKEISINNKKINLDYFYFELKAEIEYIDELLKGILKGAGSSYFSYLGAVGIATSIGTASTGTAIASLSGAAAENAILAWFGGGALTAGGGGMALGSVVLSGIVVGPAIFFAGISLSKAGEKALTQAEEFKSKVEIEIKRMEILRNEIKESEKWLSLYCKICKALENKAYNLISKSRNVSSEKEIEKIIINLILIALGIKHLLEINLLEIGTLRISEKAKSIIEEYNEILVSICEKVAEKTYVRNLIQNTLI